MDKEFYNGASLECFGWVLANLGRVLGGALLMRKNDKKWVAVLVIEMIVATLIILYSRPSGLPLVGCYLAIGLSTIGAILFFISELKADKSK